MRIRQYILWFPWLIKILAFGVITLTLLALCSQEAINNSLMLSLLDYELGKNDDFCNSTRTKEISVWPILNEFIDKQDRTTLWITGRTALACDNSVLAYQSLYPLAEKVENDPLLYQDVVMALGAQGDFQTVESIYQQFPPSTQVISDTIAFVYLAHTEDYETILRFHPNDLYATYHLWRQAMTANNFAQLEVYRDTLAHFPLSTLSPKVPRLFQYTTQIIPQLFEEGIWSQDELENVLAFLVWRSEHSRLVIDLLSQLMSQYPDAPDWSFLLAELYHRQGEWNLAQRYYSHTLSLNDAYTPAYLRLGMVYEALAKSDTSSRYSYLQSAQFYYGNYSKFAPDDLLGIERLTAVCAELGLRRAVDLCNHSIRPNPQQIASELLGIPVERVSLSSNLLPNDGKGMLSKYWHISNMSNYAPFSRALYVIAEDNWLVWRGITPGRIIELWSDWETGYSQPRAGFWAWNDALDAPLTIPVIQGEQYLVLLNYSSTDTKASIWLSENTFDSVKGDIFLPATDGEIRQFAEILSVQTKGELNCLIRYWGKKAVLFYGIGIYRLQPLL